MGIGRPVRRKWWGLSPGLYILDLGHGVPDLGFRFGQHFRIQRSAALRAGPNGAMRHIFRVVRAGETFINNYVGIKYKMLSTRFLGGIHGERANIFCFCSSEGGTHWRKWHGGGRRRGLGCGGGGCLI
jgi:hypothetical protein